MPNMLNSFLNPDTAYEKAQDQAKQAWNQTQAYEKPFWQNGINQICRLNEAQTNLMNPAALQSQWSSGYQTSPYAQQLLEMNKNQGLDAASSMGLMGSSGALNNIQSGAGNIVNQDRQQFMNDLMQKYMHGIGIGQNIYGIGANMGATMGNQSQQHGQDMATLEYGRQSAPGELFGNIAGTLANAGLNYATGGGYGMAKKMMNNQSYTG